MEVRTLFKDTRTTLFNGRIGLEATVCQYFDAVRGDPQRLALGQDSFNCCAYQLSNSKSELPPNNLTFIRRCTLIIDL